MKRDGQEQLHVVPCTIAQANEYVKRIHRHHGPLPTHRFSIAIAEKTGRVCGVAIVGLPKARALADGLTLEVNRLATDGSPNACSALYGGCRRIARDLGYRRLITYTLESESGASLRAAGWKDEGLTGGGDWWRPNQPKRLTYPTKSPLGLKRRWAVALNDVEPASWPEWEDEHAQLPLLEEGRSA